MAAKRITKIYTQLENQTNIETKSTDKSTKSIKIKKNTCQMLFSSLKPD